MKKIKSLFLTMLLLSGCYYQSGPDSVSGSIVAISKCDTHYMVTIDYRNGATRYDAGREYGELLHVLMPEYESIVDGCLMQLNLFGQLPGVTGANSYKKIISNVKLIRSQVQDEYRDEIEGFASTMSGGDDDCLGDGKLSINETWILSIMPDVLRAFQCSGISVFGPLSSTGMTMTGRALDFFSGFKGEFARTQAVTVIKNNDKSICLVGFLGNLGATTVFNEDGVFAAVLDSPVHRPNDFINKRSYVMDLRYAVELIDDNDTLEKIAGYMSDSNHRYVFNHNILLSDTEKSMVLENDLFNNRQLRGGSSTLRAGISWEFKDAIAVVNSFLLEGNVDNHTSSFSNMGKNTKRWATFNSLMDFASADHSVSPEEIRKIMSYHGGKDIFSHIYRGREYEKIFPSNGFVQHIFFVPETGELQVYFRPVDGPLEEPFYETVPVSFD